MATKAAAHQQAGLIAKTQGLSTQAYIALVAVVAVLVVVICGYLGKGIIHSLKFNGKIVAGDSTAKSALDTKVHNAPILVRNYNNLGSKQQLISDAVPVTPDFPQVVSVLSSITAASGISLDSAQPTNDTAGAASASATAPTAGPNGSVVFPFIMSVDGPYSLIIPLLQNIELSARPMRVTNITFKGTDADVQADFGIDTYYQGQSSINDTTKAVK